MEKNKKVIPFVLATALATTPFLATPAHAVSSVKVTAEDSDEAGEDSDYTIEFTIDEDLDEGDSIYIEFDKDFEIDEDMDEKDIKVNNRTPDSIDLDDNVIEIEAPRDYDADTKITVKIRNVIVNPEDEGDYEIVVSTDSDDDEDSDVIEIGDGGGNSGDDEYSIVLGDNTAGKRTSYGLTEFDLDSDLEEDEYIYVTFPNADMLPSGMDEEDVTINGEHPDKIIIDKKIVKLRIPDDVDGDDTLSLQFSADASINNPVAGNRYKLEVEYNGDTYESEQFEIVKGSYDSFVVAPTSTSVGQRTGYTFFADFGGKNRLRPLTRLTVEFPDDSMLPSKIATSDISINGKKPKKVTVDDNKVYITAPIGFDADNDVIVSFGYNAGIKNPNSAGTYHLKASITGKTITSKNFTIN